VGVCAPGDGNCYYSTLLDGEMCDDDLFYTHTDRCYSGRCIGVEDKCVRYSVQCESTNPCLYPTPLVKDSCDPPTGSCVFFAHPDGTACPSQPGMPADGTCVAGLCRRDVLDKCLGKSCPITDFCLGEAACEPNSGECVSTPKLEGEECDDGNSATYNDICIEGKCIGDLIRAPKFNYINQESCDSAGATDASYGRYFGNVKHEDECKDQCTRDPWCMAYAFGYYACYIYGGDPTVRRKNPDFAYWGKTWVVLHSSAMPVVDHGMICYEKADAESLYEVFDQKGAWFAVTVALLVVLPGIWGLYMIWPMLSHSYKSLTGCFGGVDEEVQEEPAHKGSRQRRTSLTRKEDLHLKVNPDDERDDNLRIASPRTDGAIATNPHADPEDLDELKLNQAYPPQEEMEPTDPRGQVDEDSAQQDEAVVGDLKDTFDEAASAPDAPKA